MPRRRPVPIFDNLDHLGNPYRRKTFSVHHMFPDSEAVPGTDLDYEYAWKFIHSYNGSSATFNVYRREIERLLQWAWFIHETSIFRLKREDISAYVEFCQSPPLTWIGTKNVARFVDKSQLPLS